MNTPNQNAVEHVRAALEEIRAGRMVILVDDQDRENEGDLCMAAEKVTAEAVNFMATHGRGLICLALSHEQVDRLRLPMMVHDNQAALGTAFTVSIEARHGVSTGISASDRATTVLAAIADDALPHDLVSPGHVFPLRARRGGVLVRTGQTEGSVDLARLAGLKPAGVICEIMRADGEMARMPDLEEFSARHGIPIVSVADLVTYRLQHERIVQALHSGHLRPPALGPGEPFFAHLYTTDVQETEYLALVRGDVRAAGAEDRPVLVRVQSVCPIGDSFGTRSDLVEALAAIDRVGLGVFLYVFNKAQTSMARAFERQIARRGEKLLSEKGAQSAALRDFGLGAQVLADLGCRKIRLMSDSDRKLVGIEGFGIEVVERVPVSRRAPVRAPLVPIAGGGSTQGEGDR
jgi:3,4-dihydroxy 2-butanone 4-phosphate synthase/GTP cyclohydrolase II